MVVVVVHSDSISAIARCQNIGAGAPGRVRRLSLLVMYVDSMGKRLRTGMRVDDFAGQAAP